MEERMWQDLELPVGYTALTGDGKVFTDSGILYGVLVTSDGTATYADLYEGRNTYGKLVGRFRCGTTAQYYDLPKRGVKLEKGLYVDCDSHVSHITLFWLPTQVAPS